LDTSIRIEDSYIEFPAEEELPDLQPPPKSSNPLYNAMYPLSQEVINPDYYREAAIYSHYLCNFHPLRFVIANGGEVPAEDVRLELGISASSGIEILKESQIETCFPERSRPRIDVVSSIRKNIEIQRPKVFDGVVDVSSDSKSIKIEVEYDKIQPGRRVWTDKIFVAHKNSEIIALNGQVFSKNLPKPITIELSIQFEISTSKVGLDHFLRWADNPTSKEEG
jgi:hypothetical protein